MSLVSDACLPRVGGLAGRSSTAQMNEQPNVVFSFSFDSLSKFASMFAKELQQQQHSQAAIPKRKINQAQSTRLQRLPPFDVPMCSCTHQAATSRYSVVWNLLRSRSGHCEQGMAQTRKTETEPDPKRVSSMCRGRKGARRIQPSVPVRLVACRACARAPSSCCASARPA